MFGKSEYDANAYIIGRKGRMALRSSLRLRIQSISKKEVTDWQLFVVDVHHQWIPMLFLRHRKWRGLLDKKNDLNGKMGSPSTSVKPANHIQESKNSRYRLHELANFDELASLAVFHVKHSKSHVLYNVDVLTRFGLVNPICCDSGIRNVKAI
jgi:hypothetical protein